MQRNQSEDYSRPEDVLVYRDKPGGGYAVTRMTDEVSNAAPTQTQVLVAAEALWLASPRFVCDDISVEDLQTQLSLDRGVRFALHCVDRIANKALDRSPVAPGKYRVSSSFFHTVRDTAFSRLS